ncbi:protein DpdG [Rhodospirillaceae bacterium SYSU D60014]|uniref:protein DpdG n=1 Tax=Virgifigura deserti TaxID=2268457 RepID=UPI000E67245E
MSVISRMEATPSRVRMLLAVLNERGAGETEERLRDFCSPATLLRDVPDPIAIFRSTLNAAKDLGLVEEVGDKLRVRPGVLSRRGDLGDDFFQAIEAVLLAPEAEQDLGQSDFARAVAWFLMQSPRRPLQWSENYKLWIEKQLAVPEAVRFDLTSRDRWNSFHYWCRFLGYGEVIAGRALVADPSRALQRLLPWALGGEREAAILPLLGSLAKVSPVFENGRIRREVEADAKPEFQREPQRLSPSTSFALFRLEQQRQLTLDARPDAHAMILDLGKDAPRRVSHVVIKAARS